MFFIAGKSGMQVKRPAFGAEGYVLNHLDRPSVDSYLKNTGDRLFQAFDKTTIPHSVFCDSLEVYNQDWTDDMLAEFQKRRGYDITPYLPALVADSGPSHAMSDAKMIAEVRYDWGKTITELFNERFMMPMQSWSKTNATRFRIQGYGIPAASISSNKWADISDGEGAQWKVVRAARWASSANHIYGRNVTSSETWTWLNSPVFRATPLDMKAEADIHFLQGINQLIGHGWGYTPPYVEYPGWRFYAAGAYSEQNPWWIVMPDLARYLQRMSWLLRQGSPQNDVALYLPTADAYSHFTAGKVHLIDADRDLMGEAIMPSIFEAGYNLDLFDDEVIRSEGRSENGILSLGSSKHRIVVLPGIEKMPLETLRKLNAFVRAGGKIVISRRVPEKIPGMHVTASERAEFGTIGTTLFRDGDSVRIVKTDEEVGGAVKHFLQPDVEILPSAKDFGSVHRNLDDGDLYFIASTSNQTRKVTVKLRASAANVEIMDAITGKISIPDVVSRDERSTTVALEFEPYGSCVVLFGKGKPSGEKIDAAPASAAATVDLSSDWQITFGNSTPVRFQNLRSWTDSETTKYFSGSAVYEKSFDFAPSSSSVQTKLDFGDGTALEAQPQRNGMRTWYEPPIREAAVVYVNGQRAGALWCPPYKVDISKLLKPGVNSLRIVVGNTALNYMSGRKLPDHKLLNLRYGERFQPQDMEKIEPLPSGIMGTVKLISYHWKK